MAKHGHCILRLPLYHPDLNPRIDVGNREEAVSYTHLDVYKRQALMSVVSTKMLKEWGTETVSYTHLDVYKRQVLYYKNNKLHLWWFNVCKVLRLTIHKCATLCP